MHASLIVAGGHDPHKRFGFRPFAESDTWQAEIYRVGHDGVRRPIDDGSWAYDWDELIGVPELTRPGRSRHASGGARGTVDLLDRALDWLVDHTPDDPGTQRYEAVVIVVHDGGQPRVVELVGDSREGG